MGPGSRLLLPYTFIAIFFFLVFPPPSLFFIFSHWYPNVSVVLCPASTSLDWLELSPKEMAPRGALMDHSTPPAHLTLGLR